MKRRLSVLLALALAGCGGSNHAWRPLPIGTSADFRDVFFTDPLHGWISGGGYDIAGGLIGRTRDGGKSWQFRSGIIAPATNGLHVEALHFFDAQHGLAATDGGKIFVTSNGGDDWGEVRAWSGATDYLFGFHFLDEQKGWVVGLAGVLTTDDGGAHWTKLAKTEGRAIAFVDAQNGWLVGQHAVLMSSADGGASWTHVDLPFANDEKPDLWDICFADTREGWIVGDEATLLRTMDGGQTWTRRALDIPGLHSAAKLDRIPTSTGVAVVDAGDRTSGLTLASVRFADSQHGWIAGFFANMGRSMILRTVDGGATWTIDADIDGEELRRIFVLDPRHVWAIGQRTRPGKQAIYVRDPDAK